MPEDSRSELRVLLNPIVMLALIIVLSIIALIGAAVLDWDKGKVLLSMAKPEYARGLVTYLFAVVTIGTAVVIVLSALLGSEDPIHERRFQRGKEILSLLLGVFGVIVGYYFGAEKTSAMVPTIRIVALDVDRNSVHVGEKVTVRVAVTGGTAPYSFAAAQDDDGLSPNKRLSEGQMGETELVIHAPKADESAVIHLKVVDSAGDQVEGQTQVKLLKQ